MSSFGIARSDHRASLAGVSWALGGWGALFRGRSRCLGSFAEVSLGDERSCLEEREMLITLVVRSVSWASSVSRRLEGAAIGTHAQGEKVGLDRCSQGGSTAKGFPWIRTAVRGQGSSLPDKTRVASRTCPSPP